MENLWDEDAHVSTLRFFIVDAATAVVTRYALSNEAYSEAEFETLICEAGFEDVRLLPPLIGAEDPAQAPFLAITARKPAA